MGAIFAPLAEGLSIGYQQTFLGYKEEEVRRGGNDYIASLCEFPRIYYLATAITKLAKIIFLTGPTLRAISLVCSLLPWINLPLGYFAAAVKKYDYEGFIEKKAPEGSFLSSIVPKKLSPKTVKTLTFIALKTRHIVSVAMAVASLALICFGHIAYGTAILSALAYGALIELESQNPELHWISPKVARSIERYMPKISSLALFFTGSGLIRLMASIQLIHFFRPIANFIALKLDKILRYALNYYGFSTGPMLCEYFAPFEKPLNLSLTQINEIVAGTTHLELNPSACSASIPGTLPNEMDLSKLAQTFDRLCQFILDHPKLYEDYDLFDSLPNLLCLDNDFFNLITNDKIFTASEICDNTKLQEDSKFEELIFTLIKKTDPEKSNLTRNEKLIFWLKSRMALVDKRIQSCNALPYGTFHDHETFLGNYREIIPYLALKLTEIEQLAQAYDKSLKGKTNELMSVFITIAINAGDYCNIAHVDVSNHIKDALITNLEQELASSRKRLVLSEYNALTSWMPQVFSLDRHFAGLFISPLSLGFCPTSAAERDKITGSDLLCWTVCSAFRGRMVEKYTNSLNTILERSGNEMIRLSLEEHLQHLAKAERDDLLTRYDEAKARKKPEPFYKLLLVLMGVLREKTSA